MRSTSSLRVITTNAISLLFSDEDVDYAIDDGRSYIFRSEGGVVVSICDLGNNDEDESPEDIYDQRSGSEAQEM